MNAVAPNPDGLSGLEQLKAIFPTDRPPGHLGLGSKLGFDFIEIEEGRVVFGATPDESVYNPIGTVHGGYAATLLDSAVGSAVHTKLKAGQGYATLELKVAYHRPMTAATGPVRAEGRVVQVGRRAAFAEGRLTDLEGRLYASATTTCLVFER
ncbi:MAG: PaaI family thioesterase [Phenylobacterium sp.]|nr:PaaI family thioesterase [Phenylobacterium sp.]